MIKYLFKLHPLQTWHQKRQAWHQERQAREAHYEKLMILEENFYMFLLEHPDVREALSNLDWNLLRLTVDENGRMYKLPEFSNLFAKIHRETKAYAEVGDIEGVRRSLRYVLGLKAGASSDKRMLIGFALLMFLLVLLRYYIFGE